MPKACWVPSTLLLHNQQGTRTEVIVDIDSVLKFDAVVIMVKGLKPFSPDPPQSTSRPSPRPPTPGPPTQPPVSSSHENTCGETTVTK